METPTSDGATAHEHAHKQASLAFDEYKMVADDTAKITDRRQTVNTLFVSINALFLTGVGYLFYQFFQTTRSDTLSVLFVPGFFAIAVITYLLNHTWLRLSEQNRKLINLRIRYLEQLEALLRDSNFFATVRVTLKDYETIPTGYTNISEDSSKKQIDVRGTYSLEETLYDPNARKQPFSFSQAEQRIGATFTWAYWIAFAISVIAITPQILSFIGIHATIGPLRF